MDGDRIVAFAVILVLPDLMEQLLRADDISFMLQQNTQYGKLRGVSISGFSLSGHSSVLTFIISPE